MGAYLTVPNTEKASSDDANEFMEVGASSMQGWRISQEDAHNCFLDFDVNTSLFSVYDGHGGAEVATYCAERLPAFLKELPAYKSGDFEQALKDAFLGFDRTLLEEEVIEELKRLAEKNPNQDSEVAEDDEEEDIMELCQEGSLPLDQVLEKYKGAAAKFPLLNKLKQDEAGASGSGIAKPLSPFLRGRRNPNAVSNNLDEAANFAGDAGCGPSSSTSSLAVEAVKSSINMPDLGIGDSCVSSSCSKIEARPVNSADSANQKIPSTKSNEAVSVSDTNGMKSADGVADSSSNDVINSQDSEVSLGRKTKVQNGDITSSSSSSTSSPACSGNGEVSSNSIGSKSHERAAAGGTPAVRSKGAVSSGISSSTTSVAAGGSSANAKVRAQGEMDDSSSDDDADFHAEEDNSSTEDGEEDCEPFDDESDEDENEDGEDEETDDDEEGLLDDDDTSFCRNMIEEPGKDSGCTAVVALVSGRDLYVANAGDSRCVVCRNGKAIEMSFDHKPEDEEESDRIQKAGGKVTLDGRVNGGLNLSRAIGDHAYKMNRDIPPEKQMISALPDIRKLIISPADEFMILACDGIWNYMSSDEVVEFVKKRLDEGCVKLSLICEELFDHCLAPNTMGDGTGCDNMTALLIRFKPALQNLSTKISVESEAMPVSSAAAAAAAKKRLAPPLNAEDDISSLDNESSITEGGAAPPAAKKRPASPTRSDENIVSGGAAAPSESSSSSNDDNAGKRLKTENEANVASSKEAVAMQDEDAAMSSVTTSSTESTATLTTVESESTMSTTTSTT
ncbi:probable protein phosphatase CG10417 [Hermetia illucens]|uniref:probable protein phosphatase CG10417 n=1 Tax=Hermetia illucens TaxID=343691 RepID=UPI0018CC71D2|nr:probable protein phosphatase CG10417 [Hermetia illucens]